MTDDLKPILYGKTMQVTLADGKQYTLREPDIDTLLKNKVNLKSIDDFENIKKLIYIMLKSDNESITDQNVGKLVTFAMLQGNSSFMKTFLELCGIGDAKNEKTGEQP